jgi:hypothetical protein
MGMNYHVLRTFEGYAPRVRACPTLAAASFRNPTCRMRSEIGWETGIGADQSMLVRGLTKK